MDPVDERHKNERGKRNRCHVHKSVYGGSVSGNERRKKGGREKGGKRRRKRGNEGGWDVGKGGREEGRTE